MATVEQLLAWARAQIGTVESGGPHGNDGNVVHYWDDDRLHGCQGGPWCDAFVSAGFLACGIGVPVYGYCPSSEAWYRAHCRLYARDQGQPGDQVLYDFGEPSPPNHTGIVESVDLAASTVTAIEGNTSPGIAGNQSNGGGVYRRTRPLAVVRGFGRPPFDLPAPPAPPAPPSFFTLDGDPMARLTLTIPTDQNGCGWLPPLQNVDEAKMVAVTVGGSRPAADGRYFPGEGHWANQDGHPLVSVTGAVPNVQVAVQVVFAP